MRYVTWLLITAILICAAVFVWPTRYRYDHASIAGVTMPVRIDRLTGRAELLNLSTKQWVAQSPPPLR